jgi:hypothetical protein
MKAVYHIFEAKLTGEISPGVVESTSITVLLPEGECWDLSAKGHKKVNELYAYFGPMGIRRKRPKIKPPFFDLQDDYFEDYELPWGKVEVSNQIKDKASQDSSSSEPEQPLGQ